MKILWANLHCLSDTTNGASISVATMLNRLSLLGHETVAVTASNYDRQLISPVTKYFADNPSKKLVRFEHDNFFEYVMRSDSNSSNLMTNTEMWSWLTQVQMTLKDWKPDIVMCFGARIAEQWLYREAYLRNIPTVAYLVNENFLNPDCFNYVSAIMTDSHYTANLYKRRHGLNVVPLGKFIDIEANDKPSSGTCLTFVNPSLHKGGLVFTQIVKALRDRGFVEKIVCVSSRATLTELKSYLEERGEPIEHLNSITEINHTKDMQSVYRDTKILIVPSLWAESGARVIAEAQIMGVPVFASDRGGNAEMVGDGGLIVDLPDELFNAPFDLVPSADDVFGFTDKIEKVFTDKSFYMKLSASALSQASNVHSLPANVRRLDKFLRNVSGPVEYEHSLKENEKGIFIDCGGFDGCSAIEFLAINPDFDCISFEPNPSLWHYYDKVPSTLIKKAVWIHNGSEKFFIDETDSDGSTLIKEKSVDFTGRVANSDCPVSIIDCIDIVDVMEKSIELYDKIVLKFDVEGAEYELLERLLDKGLLKKVEALYVEFHWHKMGLDKETHDLIISKVEEFCSVGDWDGLDFAVHTSNGEKKREKLIDNLFLDVESYQKVTGFN